MSIFNISFNNLQAPRYRSLANSISSLIENGRIQPEEFLPSHKVLAYKIGASIQTVASAYEELKRRGYVTGEIGRGTRVISRWSQHNWGSLLDQGDSSVIDLSILRPVFGTRHASLIRKTLAELQAQDDYRAFASYRPVGGMEHHRAAAKAWLRRLSLKEWDRPVVITNGATHGLLLAVSSLMRPGEVMATEALTDISRSALGYMLNVQVRGVAIDDQGLIPEAFDELCRNEDVKVLCCTPTLCDPTTTTMPEERRRRVAEIADKHGVFIVEDDCFSPLHGFPLTPITSYLPEQSFYITTFTKILMSGMRVGYLSIPESMVQRIEPRMRATTWMATPMAADFVTRWIENGSAEELIEWQKDELRERLNLVSEIIQGDGLKKPSTGLQCWLEMPGSWRASQFVAAARRAGVAVTAPEAFVIGQETEPQAVRLCIGSARSRDELRLGLEKLAEILSNAPEPVTVER